MERYRHWLALKKIPGVGNILFKRLLSTFSSPEAVFKAGRDALLDVEGLHRTVAGAIRSFSDFSEIDMEIARVEKSGSRLVCLQDAEYPECLAAIDDPPPILYVKGTLKKSDAVAIVGSRKMTPYGRGVAGTLSRALAELGIAIVSGFARGIDATAHQAALAVGGYTAAVLGCGIDYIYPPEHKSLYRAMAEGGALLSEFPMGTIPAPHHFPQRNRIISGMALGCVVIEAPINSGSLITARHALEQGREVFAVPGPITSMGSAGPHHLIHSGAKLVTQVQDILEEILPHLTRLPVKKSAETPQLPENEAHIYQLLRQDPKHIDQIACESGRSIASVASALLTLEMKEHVRALPGQFYTRVF